MHRVLVGAGAVVVLAACPTWRAVGPGVDGAALADAHVHLSLGTAADLDSLLASHVTVVRDAGGDVRQLVRWRAEIAAGERQGPRLFVAGPILDGPKPDAPFRLTVRTVAEATAAVDSLAALGVDFVKTHSAVSPPVLFAVLRQARLRHLPVAAHLPRDVPAWVAADSGVASIEHMAESLLNSPIAAGYAATVPEAIAWWRSPAGTAALQRMARRGVAVVPTLVRYEASIAAAPTPALRDARAAVLPDLLALTGAAYRAGIPLLVGSDLVGLPGARPAWQGPAREITLLIAAGVPPVAARAAASPDALVRWFRRR